MAERSDHEQPSLSSSCSACDMLNHRCRRNFVFSPYFRSDEPMKFVKLHKVFYVCIVENILWKVPKELRQETVNSLIFEAEAILHDPIKGSAGFIVILKRRLAELQEEVAIARASLAEAVANAAANSINGSSVEQEYSENNYIGDAAGSDMDEDDCFESNSSSCDTF